MRDIFQGRNFKVLITVVAALVVVMLISAASGGKQNIFSSAISFITTPIQRVASAMTGASDDVADAFENPVKLKEENEALKKSVRNLTSSLIEYEQAMQENERLREILGLKEENPDFEFLPASVIMRDSGDNYKSFTIDRGSTDDVALYDPVLTADGLVGYITEVGPLSSTVTTILDPSLKIGAFDRRSRDGGVVSGEASLAKNGQTKLGMLKREYDIVSGDIIVTSGLGGIFPKNLVIGTVKDVKPESQSISLYAIIEPAADILECRDVFILTSFSGQGSVVDGELFNTTSSDSDE